MTKTTSPHDLVWNQTMGAILRTARKRLGLTIRQAANLIGTTQWSIAAYERGSRRPDARRLLEMTIHLQLDLNDLAKKALGWSTAGDSTRTTKTRHHDSRQLQLKDV